MPRSVLLWALAFGLVTMAGCREPLDFSRALTADVDRGQRLYNANCANTCHPDNAFDKKSVKSYEELAYTVRDYLERVEKDRPAEVEQGSLLQRASMMGGQQDVFDIARYLNDKHYKFKRADF